MAEGVLRTLLARAGLGASFEIDSVGTHNYQSGKPPFEAAVMAAKRRGYDIATLIARPLRPHDLDHFDMIIAMDKANIAHLLSISPTRCKSKIELLLEYGDKYYGKEIPDPYGKQPRDYELALDMIEDGCRGLADYLARLLPEAKAGGPRTAGGR